MEVVLAGDIHVVLTQRECHIDFGGDATNRVKIVRGTGINSELLRKYTQFNGVTKRFYGCTDYGCSLATSPKCCLMRSAFRAA